MAKTVEVIELKSYEVIDFRVGIGGYKEYKVRDMTAEHWGEEKWVSWSGHQPINAEGEPATVGSIIYHSQCAVLVLQEFEAPEEVTAAESDTQDDVPATEPTEE